MVMSWERSTTHRGNPIGKVIILIPHRGEQDYREWVHWWKEKLIKPPSTTYLEQRGVSLTTNRTGLVIQALETDAQYFFFLDDDIIGPDNLLTTLLSYNAPIISGLYMAKKKKEHRGLAAWVKSPQGNGYAPIHPTQPARLVQVDVIGLGCCLIHRSVFEKVPQPWFTWDWEGPSEDFSFFEKVHREAGIKPLVDMECKLWHIGVHKVFVNGTFTTLEL